MPEVLKNNPFVVLTPDNREEEEITHAPTIHKLFVNVFEDFTTIPQQGHVFINGPRGSGKSMMFRFMLPDCQLIHNSVSEYSKLNYFSIHIPIKLTSINNPEYELLKDYSENIFNEHVLSVYFLDIIFDSFCKLNFEHETNKAGLTKEIISFYKESFEKKLKLCGWKPESKNNFNPQTPKEAFEQIKEICSELFSQTDQYLKRNAKSKKSPSVFIPQTYSGPLCDYLNFLFPILKDVKKISFFPKGKPLFLLIDDADNLSESQTIVLNTWVSYRTNSEVSLKITTQLKYKTYNTIYGTNIDSPHDYYDINIQTTYSSSKSLYHKRIKQIVERRLENFYNSSDIITPEEFFRPDEEQEQNIEKEKDLLRKKFKQGEGKGFRESDDLLRYAEPNYLVTLSGSAKSIDSYSYSGFDRLVSISSGIIRFFLTPAGKMFNETYRDLLIKNNYAIPQDVKFIPPKIQNDVIKMFAVSQLFEEYDKLKKNKSQIESDPTYLTKVQKLRNLIEGLGTLFHEYLLAKERSERKIFSFAISDKLDQELEDVLQLGIELGYFQLSSIGKKKGSGRTRLYILSRILAPYFKLVPSGFAGYKFFTADKLRLGMTNPDKFKNTYKGLNEKEEELEDLQQTIDFE